MSSAYRKTVRRRGDLLAFALSLASVVALLTLFPFDVFVRGRVSSPPPARVPVSLVALSPADEARIVAAARSAWRVSALESGRVHIDLYGEKLPPAGGECVSDLADTGSRQAAPRLAALSQDVRSLLPPTRAARPPRTLGAPVEDSKRPAFSRADLLEPCWR